MKEKTYFSEAETMSLYYKKLFIIEYYIKNSLDTHDCKTDLYFHEYIPLLNKKFFSEKFKKKLYKLVKVRNKICHMKSLNFEEIQLLTSCYNDIINEYNP